MKKILGIVALTMIAGVPAFAADTTAIDYVLQIGGSNAGGPGVKFDTTNVVEEGDAGPLYTTDQDIVTWSVAVDVSGYIGEPGLEIYVGGAANLVWDLTLLGPDGQPVGTGGTPFGLGSPTTPGFYSSIMNGTGIFKLQPASFTWEFGDGAPFGRLQDQDLANGANMLQFTFPSTYSYYCNDVTGVTYTTTAQVLAGTGTLMGMGAGYQELDQATGGVERTGVGISDDQGIYMCAQLIGDKAPIAEGQINMAGLPNGTYTLVLTPGEGNNVIWNADNSYVCMIGTTGAFAVKAKNVTGGQLSFVRNAAVTTGTLTVTIAGVTSPPGQFSVDGGATWNNAGQITLPAGSYTVTAAPVAGYYTPAPQNVTITAGADTAITLTYVVIPPPPVLAAAKSWKTHTATGLMAIQFYPYSSPTATYTDPRSRSGVVGPEKITVEYDVPISIATAVITVTDVTRSLPIAVGTPVVVGGNVLEIPFTSGSVVDKTCLHVDISGVVRADDATVVAPAVTLRLRIRNGDVNSSGTVTGADATVVRGLIIGGTTPLDRVRADVNCSGDITGADATVVNARNDAGADVTDCP